MLDFYRRFLPDIAKTLASINEILHGNVRGKTPILWSSSSRSDRSIARKFGQSHSSPKINAELALFTDASNQSIEAALQQRGDNGWKPLTFSSKKLSPAETKYSAFDRELLVIYLAIKHFKHMFEAKTFVIYTDHKQYSHFDKNQKKVHLVIWIS